jgi:hypothetical protein
MYHTSIRNLFLVCGLIFFSGLSVSSEKLNVSPITQEKQTGHENLSFSVCDQGDTHAFLSSSKEDVTGQFSQHKIKFFSASSYATVKINYRYTHVFYQSVLAHSYILGRTSALRAPPSSLFS